jgi:hypothetical protein
MLDCGNGHMIRRRKPVIDRAADVATIQELSPAPVSVQEVMDRLGWAQSRARLGIMQWRSAYGIETPRNGAAAAKIRGMAA